MAKKKRTANPHARISHQEANDAIYVDCEGYMDSPPKLIGIQVGRELEQVVLDPALEQAAEAKGLRVSSLEEEVHCLLKRSMIENRLIVAYSQHERNLFRDYAQVDLGLKYRDARMIAKYWRNKCKPAGVGKSNALKDFLKAIGYPLPPNLAEKKAAGRIKAVHDMLVRKGSYEFLTRTVKNKWTNLLKYNRIDCDGMRALTLRASEELNGSSMDKEDLMIRVSKALKS